MTQQHFRRIALGMTALITVLSVMNGFQREIRSRILSVASHVQVSAAGGKICGAGGGGYLLLACGPERQAAVREALEGVGGQFAAFAFRSHGVEARSGERVWRPL